MVHFRSGRELFRVMGHRHGAAWMPAQRVRWTGNHKDTVFSPIKCLLVTGERKSRERDLITGASATLKLPAQITYKQPYIEDSWHWEGTEGAKSKLMWSRRHPGRQARKTEREQENNWYLRRQLEHKVILVIDVSFFDYARVMDTKRRKGVMLLFYKAKRPIHAPPTDVLKHISQVVLFWPFFYFPRHDKSRNRTCLTSTVVKRIYSEVTDRSVSAPTLQTWYLSSDVWSCIFTQTAAAEYAWDSMVWFDVWKADYLDSCESDSYSICTTAETQVLHISQRQSALLA